MGRPAYEFDEATRSQVADLATARVDYRDIARLVGCHRNTLCSRVAAELAAGLARRRLEVIEALYARAVAGGVAAARLYLGREPQPVG